MHRAALELEPFPHYLLCARTYVGARPGRTRGAFVFVLIAHRSSRLPAVSCWASPCEVFKYSLYPSFYISILWRIVFFETGFPTSGFRALPLDIYSQKLLSTVCRAFFFQKKNKERKIQLFAGKKKKKSNGWCPISSLHPGEIKDRETHMIALYIFLSPEWSPLRR